MAQCKIDAVKLLHRVTIRVKVVREREAIWRIRAVYWLLRLASWISGISIEFEE